MSKRIWVGALLLALGVEIRILSNFLMSSCFILRHSMLMFVRIWVHQIRYSTTSHYHVVGDMVNVRDVILNLCIVVVYCMDHL